MGTINLAERLLFLQPQSILHRAVYSLVGFYDVRRPGRTAFSIDNAAKFFSLTVKTLKDVCNKNKKLALDDIVDVNKRMEASNAQHAAKYALRIPCIQLLRIAIARTGGLRRISQLRNMKAQNAAAAHARLVPIVERELQEFNTFITNLRQVTMNVKTVKLCRLKDKLEGISLNALIQIRHIRFDLRQDSGVSKQFIRQQLVFLRGRM